MEQYTQLQKAARDLSKKLKLKQIVIAARDKEVVEFAGHGHSLGHFELVLQLVSFMIKEERYMLEDLYNKSKEERALVVKLRELEPLIDEILVAKDSWDIFPNKRY